MKKLCSMGMLIMATGCITIPTEEYVRDNGYCVQSMQRFQNKRLVQECTSRTLDNGDVRTTCVNRMTYPALEHWDECMRARGHDV